MVGGNGGVGGSGGGRLGNGGGRPVVARTDRSIKIPWVDVVEGYYRRDGLEPVGCVGVISHSGNGLRHNYHEYQTRDLDYVRVRSQVRPVTKLTAPVVCHYEGVVRYIGSSPRPLKRTTVPPAVYGVINI